MSGGRRVRPSRHGKRAIKRNGDSIEILQILSDGPSGYEYCKMLRLLKGEARWNSRTEIQCPHLHIYREGHGDKWAIAAPVDRYSNTQALFSTFAAFMDHCNITDSPQI